VAIMTGRGGVLIWDLSSGQPRDSSLAVPIAGPVWSLGFNHDGTILATQFRDVHKGWEKSGVLLWDVASARLLTDKPLALPKWAMIVIAFGPDKETLAAAHHNSASNTNGVKFWDVGVAACQRRARRIANRNLTWDEWRQ
jgi:WD40 repeat protein